jgi:DNA-directed RNA polymerase subunit H (RpoH/RPB5)
MVKPVIRWMFRRIGRVLLKLLAGYIVVLAIAGGLGGCLLFELENMRRQGKVGLEREFNRFPAPQMPDLPTPREVFQKYGIENWGLPTQKPPMPHMPTAREVFQEYGIENWGLPQQKTRSDEQ